MGFTHVRLPVDGEALMPAFADSKGIADKLREVDLAVDLLLTLDYAVIIDMHPGSRFARLQESNPDRALDQLETAWSALAGRLVSRDPERVFFELLNEPAVGQATWQDQAAKLAAAIRTLAPDHTLIYGPSGAQEVTRLAAIEPLNLPNVVYASHFYQPMVFTHQGRDWGEWTPLAELKGVPYPLAENDSKAEALVADLAKAGRTEAAQLLESAMEENWDDRHIAANLAPAADWALRYRKPIIIDEFGVLSHYANLEDRARWLRAVRTEAERYCFGWTHWEFDEGFGFLDPSGMHIEPALAHALLGP
jgi:endoglucanase